MRITADGLAAAMRQGGFRVATAPLELNIVGLRAPSTTPNRFDDLMCAMFTGGDGRRNLKVWRCTTDPGTFWLRQPMSPQGTAILKGNRQYAGAYRIGLHRGQYEALVQTGAPVTVIRDYDRDDELDFLNGREATGMFGINIHRASRTGESLTVDKHSAGCQVIADAGDFAELMSLCRQHRDRHGNRFTYTLLDFRALKRAKAKRLALGIGGAAALTLTAVAAITIATGEKKG